MPLCCYSNDDWKNIQQISCTDILYNYAQAHAKEYIKIVSQDNPINEEKIYTE